VPAGMVVPIKLYQPLSGNNPRLETYLDS
jgi:hypothetical protein